MNKQVNFKIQALILSLFIISLDAYSLFNIPLQWIGLSFLSLFLLINLKFIKTRFNSILYLFGTLLFLPILFEIISDNSLLGNLSYQLRIFNFVTFLIAFYTSITFFENINKESFINYLEKFLVLISLVAIYIFFSQIFDLYEPLRNRSNTSFRGSFSIQTTFWPYEPHRAMSTFREPVLFISYMIPLSFILFFEKKKLKFNTIIIISLALGLSRSDLLRIYIFLGLVLYIIIGLYKKSFEVRKALPLILILLFSLISIKECALSPNNQECKDLNVATDVRVISFENIDSVTEIDTDRSNTLDYLTSGNIDFVGEGFNSILKNFQNYVTEEINKEMYLTNRVLPEFLNSRYQAQNFGTGDYPTVFYPRNTQSLFVNLLAAFGIFPLIIISLLLYVLVFKRRNTRVVEFIFLTSFFFIIPLEEFNALTGLILGYAYTIFIRKQIIE
tara:strand:- start:707 stop:2041 length:1335 start_codon:yes stop_codon:yes gene_type:complete